MKILNLSFKNINSLEGESLIDFQKKPLLNTGVFAIIGPNGSGKSSILDAITLALYGETFRFDRPAEHVMTHHTTESFAQIEFSLDTKKFRCRWEVKRQNNNPAGELQLPEMSLFALDGLKAEMIEDDSHVVCEKISDIIGMDFHNFSRSIMLAQGDFAAFLNALDNERMDILEKMSRADIYNEHKQQLKTKKEQSAQAVKQIEMELKQLPLMDDVEIETCEQDLLDFKEQFETQKQQQSILLKQSVSLKKIETLEQQFVESEAKQKRAKNEMEQAQQKLQQVSNLKSVNQFEKDVKSITGQQQQVVQSEKTLKNYRRELTQLEANLKALDATENSSSLNGKSVAEQKQEIDNLRYLIDQKKVVIKTEESSIVLINSELAKQKASHDEILKWLEIHKAEKSLQEGFPETVKLKQLREELAESENQYGAVSRQFNSSKIALEKIESSANENIRNISENKQALAETEKELVEMEQEYSLVNREEMVADQRQRVADFKELLILARINNRVTKKGFFGLFKSKKEIKELTIEDLETRADLITQEIGEAQFLRKTLEQAIINEAALLRLQAERQNLENGKPCPLCGALQHPFALTPPKNTNSKQALIFQNEKLKQLILSADTLKKKMLSLQKREINQQDKDNNLQRNRSQWMILSNKLNVAYSDLDIGNFTLMKDFLKTEESELKSVQQLLKAFQQKQTLQKKFTTQLDLEQKNSVKLKNSEQELREKVVELPKNLAELGEALAQVKANEKTLTDKTEQQLAALMEKMPTKNQDDLLVDRLKVRKKIYEDYQEREQLIAKELAGLNEKIKHSQQKTEQLDKDVSQHIQALAGEQSVGLHLSLVEKQKLIADKEHILLQQQQQLKTMTAALNNNLQGSQFSTVDELKDALILVAKKNDFTQNVSLLQQRLEQFKSNQQQLKAQLEAVEDIGISLAELEIKERALNEKIAITQAEIGHLNRKQQRQAGAKERQSMLSENLQYQHQVFSESEENLRQSEENGVVFRRRVQLKMATELLSQTNKILEKISGRYYIRQAPSDTGLALEIEDTKLQNSRRLPKSLSGGESFVVSLALALGLSELANNGRAVDSLFLDEGFGNLDSDTLYTVVSTLKNLQTHGKVVGVISHVERVKKLIKTRIEMTKKTNGLSQLKKIS